jgi:hypothetical protein
MLIEDLIKILNEILRTDGKKRTQALIPDGDYQCKLVGYVVHNPGNQSVIFYADKPDWSEIEKDEDIEITVISETDYFAQITHRD